MVTAKRKPKQLGQILLEQGLLSQEQLDHALQEHRNTPKSLGRTLIDLGYIKERDLVRMYHDTLVERGVRGYEFDRCWLEYRRSVMFLIVYSVIAMGSIDLANERGVELFTTILKRTLAAIEDLKAYEVLD